MKEKYDIWHVWDAAGRPTKVQCRHCSVSEPWRCAGNATRMAEHMRVKHPPKGEPAKPEAFETVSDPSGSLLKESPLKKMRRESYFDRPFTDQEQLEAEKAQALHVVLNAFSYNSQQNPATVDFFKKLRPDYRPPSVYRLEQHLIALEVGIREKLMQLISSFGVCSLAVDGWTDPQSFSSLAFTVGCPDGRTFMCFDNLIGK